MDLDGGWTWMGLGYNWSINGDSQRPGPCIFHFFPWQWRPSGQLTRYFDNDYIRCARCWIVKRSRFE